MKLLFQIKTIDGKYIKIANGLALSKHKINLGFINKHNAFWRNAEDYKTITKRIDLNE